MSIRFPRIPQVPAPAQAPRIPVVEPKLSSVEVMLDFIEERIRREKSRQLDELMRVVAVNAHLEMFWYATDDKGMIAIKQDAPFICDGIIVVGDRMVQGTQFPLGGTTPNYTIPFALSLEDLGPSRFATEGSLPTPPGSASGDVYPQAGFSIPLESFLPTVNVTVDGSSVYSSKPWNVDYWYSLPSEWTLPRGDTIRCRYIMSTDGAPVPGLGNIPPITPPNVILTGYKVFA